MRSRRSSIGVVTLVCLAIVAQGLAAVPAGAQQKPPKAPPVAPAEEASCGLYPLAPAASSLAGVAPGGTVADIVEGTGPGNFGWLSWTGDNGVPRLAKSLTPPGDSHTYVNPDNPADHSVSVGDRLRGRPGVANSRQVRDALDDLKKVDVVLPVWDQTAGAGANATYRVSRFAVVRLLGYDLPKGRISVRYVADAACSPVPIGGDITASTAEDTPVAVTLSAATTSGGTLQFATTAPSHGGLGPLGPPTCTTTAGTTTCTALVTYTPQGDFSGPDSFTYTARAGSAQSAPATVAITVTPVNDSPRVGPDARSTRQARTLSFPAAELLTNDAAGPPDEAAQTLAVATVSGGSDTHGTVALAEGTVTYRPDPAFSGTASFAYSACDNGTTNGSPDPKCATGSVRVTVVADRAPAAEDRTATTAEDTSVSIVLPVTDPDGDPFTCIVTSGPTRGSLSGGCTVTYAPNANDNGRDSFSYKANDGTSDSNVATVSITITPVNDPPAANPDTKSTNQGEALTFPAAELTANDTAGPPDEASQALTVTRVIPGPATNGDVALVSGVVTYTPRAGFSGEAGFTYEVCDPGSLCAQAAVALIVQGPANRPPAITSVPTVSEWMNLTPAGARPTPRYLYGAQAYDEVNDRIIIFSGEDNVSPHPLPADVWVLTNATGVLGPPAWLELRPSNSGPSGRFMQTMAYDPTANRLIVHGGCNDHGCGARFGDAWVLTNANGLGGVPEWRQLPGSQAVAGGGGAYDLISNRLIVFGGHIGVGSDLNTTRVLVDANGIGSPRWEALPTTGGPPPAEGAPSSVTYDQIGNRLIAYGGNASNGSFTNDVWVLTSANGLGGTATWSKLDPTGVLPGARTDVSSVFDANSDTMITFGGGDGPGANNHLNETWALRHASGSGGTPTWRQLPTSGRRPTERIFASVGYYRASNRMVVTLGRNAPNPTPGVFDDTWVLTNASGQCTAGQPCNYDVDAADPDGNALSFALTAAPAGMSINASTGIITWTPTPTQMGDHAVTVRVVDPAGLAATQSFTLTVAGVVVPNVVGLDPASARALLGSADLRVRAETVLGGGIKLAFDRLPSEQGAMYATDPSTPAPERQVFAVDGTTLHQNSLGTSCSVNGSYYRWPDDADRRLPYTLRVRARVLEEEGNTQGNSFGFFFGIETGTWFEGVGLGTRRISDVHHNTLSTEIDNTQFHDYRLDGVPGTTHRLFVDNALIGTANSRSSVSSNAVQLGDGTCGTNARADVTRFEFEQPRVVSQDPPAGTRVMNKSAVDLTIAQGPGLGLPEAVGDSFQTSEDTVLNVPAPGVLANDRDPEGGPLTAVLATGPTSGAVTLRPDGSFTYTPGPNFSGADSFRYKANDGSRDSNVVTVNITVREVNDLPVASPDSRSTKQDKTITFPATDLTANDSSGPANETPQALTVTSVTGATLAAGTVTYTPAPGFAGPATFTYAVCDNGTTAGAPDPLCATGTVTVTVAANRAPVAVDQSMSTAEDTAKPIALTATDADGDPLTFTVAAPPTHGSLAGMGATRTYTPAPNYNGPDSFTFKANDGAADSNTATVSITVTAVNDPPVSVADAKAASQGGTLTFPAADLAANDTPGPADEATQTLAVTDVAATPQTNGTVSLAVGGVTYTPAPSFSGNATFAYTVCDNGTPTACATGTVTVNVSANRPPVAVDQTVTTSEDTTRPITLGATDPDGDALTFTIVAAPLNGTPTGTGADRSYAPKLNLNGPDSLTFKANDGRSDSNVATVSITVTPVNDAPTALPDPKSTNQAQALSFPAADLTVNDSPGPADEASQTLIVTAVTSIAATHGTVTLASGTVTYTPEPGFSGDAGFNYTVCDNGSTAGGPDPKCATAMVTVTVASDRRLATIDLTPRGVNLDPGQTRQFAATGRYSDGSSADITATAVWSSSETGIATVSATGLASAVSAGTTSIQATAQGVTGATALSVGGATITSVVVEPATALILVGQPQAFTARGVHADGTSETLSGAGLTWSTSAPDIATVAANGVASGAGAGSATITATFAGKAGASALTVRAATPNSGPSTAAITAPGDGSTVTKPTTVTGTATDPEFLKYVLEIAPAGQSTFTTIVESTTPVTDGTLGTLDPTLLLNDLYTLRLTVTDTANVSTPAAVTVQVDREMKVGNFTVAFDDLTIPMPGLDVTVTRTYDSRDKTVGDFGVGWQLGVRSARVRPNRLQGTGWHVEERPGSFGTRNYFLVPDTAHKVSVTLPDGEVEEFDMAVSPSQRNGTRFSPAQDLTVSYVARAGTLGSLRLLGDTTVILGDSDQPGGPGTATLYYDEDLTPFNPQRFEYTSPDGTRIVISRSAGVESVADTTGNSLTITPAGITHSSGVAVSFVRDGQGRITEMVDPRGNRVTYAYDANGDLATHTDPAANVTRFLYDRRHNLLEIRDPQGRRPVRNEYDDAGRLVKVIDAEGNEVAITHDIGTNTERVTDRRGNTTVFSYDNDGNVLSETNAAGTTRREYDAQGNETKVTDPLGLITERTYDGRRNLATERTPLGNVTRFTYGLFDQVATVTDPLGNVTTNTYAPGTDNLTSTVACGATTSFTYDARGNVLTVTDALSKMTTNTYAANGNLSSTTDPNGVTTTYAYDANNNRTSSSVVRTTPGGPQTLVTSYTYDANNRLVRTTHPDGASSNTVYDSAGRAVASIDELGRVTRYEHDSKGQLVRTVLPDGTTQQSGYDANGNQVTSTDQAGRVTTTRYDNVDRPDRVTYPDTTFTGTGYDAAGRAVTQTDEAGNTTTSVHDNDGRLLEVRRPLGLTVSYAYDAGGRKTSETDPAGARSFLYDCAGRLTRTTFPDATFTSTGYDVLGRRTSNTDQAGKVTGFGYDNVGRLTSVTDALNQVTRYGYDEVGSRLSQTDALGRATRFEYDRRGRQVARVLPLGQREIFTHDAAGNVESKQDFNGRTTTFTHDALNRLTSKVPDPFFAAPTVSFTYKPTGQRAAMVDATGTTTYAYDSRDRLVTKATPQGTLMYTYDPTGKIGSLETSNAGGASVGYEYDGLGRLSKVNDRRLASGETTYGYDPASRLASVTYPNGVQHAYSYDNLSRLQDLRVTRGGTTLASYAYSLGPSGNRTSVLEADGRKVDYGYDALYRLTSETVASDAGGINGSVSYVYDAVGNRQSRTSSLAGVPTTTSTYDANDRITIEDYDANGNTLRTADHTYTYDYEDKLVGADSGAVSITYDGDGTEVAETVGGMTSKFLVDELNPTGYSQVADEVVGGFDLSTYTYGTDLISHRINANEARFYEYDGHNSVRSLTDSAGAPTSSYVYDAFGVGLRIVGQASDNPYQFAGERSIRSISAYHMRARNYSPASGRFFNLDPAIGSLVDPVSLHDYSYVGNDPTNKVDPSGEFFLTLIDLAITVAVSGVLRSSEAKAKLPIGAILGARLSKLVLCVAIKAIALNVLFSVTSDAISSLTGYAAFRALGRFPAMSLNDLKSVVLSGLNDGIKFLDVKNTIAKGTPRVSAFTSGSVGGVSRNIQVVVEPRTGKIINLLPGRVKSTASFAERYVRLPC